MDVLADEPDMVVCDLSGMAGAAASADMLSPAIAYLADWPGPLVLVAAPDDDVRTALTVATDAAPRMLVRADPEDLDAAMADEDALPPVRRARLQLPPQPTAPRDARDFVSRTLAEWSLPSLTAAASLVVSELATNSLLHAVTVLDVTLSRVDGRVRVAVRDRGGGVPAAVAEAAGEHTLDGRGLQLVQAVSRSWGVIPAASRGKTVWAVLDSRDELAASG